MRRRRIMAMGVTAPTIGRRRDIRRMRRRVHLTSLPIEEQEEVNILMAIMLRRRIMLITIIIRRTASTLRRHRQAVATIPMSMSFRRIMVSRHDLATCHQQVISRAIAILHHLQSVDQVRKVLHESATMPCRDDKPVPLLPGKQRAVGRQHHTITGAAEHYRLCRQLCPRHQVRISSNSNVLPWWRTRRLNRIPIRQHQHRAAASVMRPTTTTISMH